MLISVAYRLFCQHRGDIRPSSDSDSYVGLQGRFKIIKLNQRRDNIVLSRRARWKKERFRKP
jgi:ribosomal protein S1